MFGYVRPSDGHLTAEDKQRFQAAYCGLCRSLGRISGPDCGTGLLRPVPQSGPEIRPGGPDDPEL